MRAGDVIATGTPEGVILGMRRASNDRACVAVVFTGEGNRDLDFWGRRVLLRSANGPRDCIIDCQASDVDSHRGFILNQREGSGARLEGVDLTGADLAGAQLDGA